MSKIVLVSVEACKVPVIGALLVLFVVTTPVAEVVEVPESGVAATAGLNRVSEASVLLVWLLVLISVA